jgi:hypothetical protein
MLKKYLKNSTVWTQPLLEIIIVSKVIFQSNQLTITKVNLNFYEYPIAKN